MFQSYLVTEDDNKKLNSDQEVFDWLASVLDCSVHGKFWKDYTFDVSEILQVEQTVCLIRRYVFYS